METFALITTKNKKERHIFVLHYLIFIILILSDLYIFQLGLSPWLKEDDELMSKFSEKLKMEN